jgi:hypothetical protein
MCISACISVVCSCTNVSDGAAALFLCDAFVQYFAKRDFDDLSLAGEYNEKGTTAWYDNTENVEIFVGDKAVSIDRDNKIVVSEQGRVSVNNIA